MLTLNRTLNAVWNQHTSPEMSIQALFMHYANPTGIASFFHLGRSNKQAVQSAIDTAINTFSTISNDTDSSIFKAAYLLAAVCSATPARNGGGELAHRLKYICNKLKWHITEEKEMSGATPFNTILNKQLNALGRLTLNLSKDNQAIIRENIQELLRTENFNQQKNRVIIFNKDKYIVGIGYQNSTVNTFELEPALAYVVEPFEPLRTQRTFGFSNTGSD